MNREPKPSVSSRFCRVLGALGELMIVAKEDEEETLAVSPPMAPIPLPWSTGAKSPTSQGLPNSGSEERPEAGSPLTAQATRCLGQARLGPGRARYMGPRTLVMLESCPLYPTGPSARARLKCSSSQKVRVVRLREKIDLTGLSWRTGLPAYGGPCAGGTAGSATDRREGAGEGSQTQTQRKTKRDRFI